MRHLQPIDTAHILTPTQDLPGETFDGVERRASSTVCLLRLAAHLRRQQEAGVEVLRHGGVEQIILVLQHRVLEVAKARQGVLDEVRERPLCVGAGRGEPERLDLAEVAGKAPRDQIEHGARDPIGCKPHGLRQLYVVPGGLPVLRIEVPALARRLTVLVDEKAGALAHLAIERLHDELAPTFRPVCERPP
jgi:hypothetical protein